MRLLILASALVVVTGLGECASAQHHPLKEDVYIDSELRKINAHFEVLVKLGKADPKYRFHAEQLIADYGWHEGLCKFYSTGYTHCYFGAYTYSEGRYQMMLRGERPSDSGVIGESTMFRGPQSVVKDGGSK